MHNICTAGYNTSLIPRLQLGYEDNSNLILGKFTPCDVAFTRTARQQAARSRQFSILTASH